MTVDMLAATFFWPEGTLLGAQAISHDATPDETARDDLPDADDATSGDGFWATVARNLWRPAGGPSTGAVG